MAQNNENLQDSSPPQESIDQWTCPQCFKNISSSRPPVFNADNCSCAEAAAYTNGTNGLLSRLSPNQNSILNYDTTTHLFHQSPRSYASSSLSVPSPEGPEHPEPDLKINNSYLPLGPEKGLNETQHRRSASFESDMSYQMRRFLIEQDYEEVPAYATEHAARGSKFLAQDPYIQYQSSISGGKQSMRSKHSMKSYGSGDISFASWGVDPVTGSGGWVDEYGNTWADGTYPLAMSGLTECLFGDRRGLND